MGWLETLLTGAAGAAVVGGVFKIVQWCLERRAAKADREDAKEEEKQEQTCASQRREIQEIKETHERDMAELRQEFSENWDQMQKELTLHTYALLSALRGLAEKGCNGPVKEGIQMIEKFINKQAHAHKWMGDT